MHLYNEEFFSSSEKDSKVIARIVMSQVINWINPKSIVDFGCGEGIWLSVAKTINDKIDVFGIDGDYINRKRLKIPEKCFYPANLEEEIQLKRKYDLAISLEVAEHLDAEFSDLFVESLTNSSDNILFSAAIPGQGGENHVNEQWQSYWIEKFVAKGYAVDTSIRDFFWTEMKIAPWRRQNILFFSRHIKGKLITSEEIYDVVHPEMFEYILKNKKSEQMVSIKEIYCRMDKKIGELVDRGYKNFVIYPFGENGFLCKEILNHKYNIREAAIIDNRLCRFEKNILSASQLKNIEGEYCILENCSNPKVHDDVLDEVKKYVKEINIFTIFEKEVK